MLNVQYCRVMNMMVCSVYLTSVTIYTSKQNKLVSQVAKIINLSIDSSKFVLKQISQYHDLRFGVLVFIKTDQLF